MSEAPEKLLALSERLAARGPLWVQGAGGNTSLKHGDELWIKASGSRLAEIRKPGSCTSVGLTYAKKKLLELVTDQTDDAENRYSRLLGELGKPGYGRPSMEAGFHILLPKKWVLHFHSIAALLFAHQFRIRPDLVRKALAHHSPDLEVQFFAPISPGLGLSSELSAHPNGEALILQNHGVVLQSDDETIVDRWEALERAMLPELGYGALVPLLKGNRDSLADFLTEHPEGKLRLYFPDTAVFQNELRSFLSRGSEDRYSLGAENLSAFLAYKTSPQISDLTEIWIATRVLEVLEPALSELPAEIGDHVGRLPTELARRERIL